MQVSHVTTKSTHHDVQLEEVVRDLVAQKVPFTVHIDFHGSVFPCPNSNGVFSNYKIEQPVRNLLIQTFGASAQFN